MDDIAIDLSYANKKIVAVVHFNQIKMSSTIKDSDIDNFCLRLADELRSTPDKMRPLPGKSSATVSRFDPSSVSIHYDDINPISSVYVGAIQRAISEFVYEKAEFATLFAEAQHSET